MALSCLVPRLTIEKEFEKFSVYSLMNRCKEDGIINDASKSEHLCRAIATVTAGSRQQVDGAQILVDCLDCGVCEALVEIINKFATESSVVASYACLAICNMAYGSLELREYLGEVGACESIIFAMNMNIGHPETSEYGSCAVGILAFNHIGNSFRLAQAGACECIAQTGNFGFNLRHPRCQIVAANVCTSLCYLCEASISRQLFESGVAAVLTTLLRQHIDSDAVVLPGIKAMCGLASLNPELRAMLGKLESSNIVMDIIGKYAATNTGILIDSCETILHLAIDQNNVKSLHKLGACKAVTAALLQLSDVSLGSEICTGALVNLCTIPSAAVELYELGGIELLKATQHSRKASFRARENIQKLIESMNVNKSKSPSSSTASTSSLSSLSSAINSNMSFTSNNSNANGSTNGNQVVYTEFRSRTSSTGSDCDDK
jgi:hypothetical protein